MNQHQASDTPQGTITTSKEPSHCAIQSTKNSNAQRWRKAAVCSVGCRLSTWANGSQEVGGVCLSMRWHLSASFVPGFVSAGSCAACNNAHAADWRRRRQLTNQSILLKTMQPYRLRVPCMPPKSARP
jgi:hypothetical protein